MILSVLGTTRQSEEKYLLLGIFFMMVNLFACKISGLRVTEFPFIGFR